MGWKGTMRSISAATRRMEKDAERRHKAAIKEQTGAASSNAVANWEDYMDELVSVHKNLGDRIDWSALTSKPEPKKPLLRKKNQDNADKALDNFRPNKFDIFRGAAKKRKQGLENTRILAEQKDNDLFRKAKREYTTELKEWENDGELAVRVLKGEPSAIREVIAEMQSLSKTDLVGSSVNFVIAENCVHALTVVHSDDIVPNYRRKKLASGKLSETKMPVGQFNELYQDYVSSVALKVAGDLFQILPINDIYVTCMARMLNSATGHQADTPILSVQFVRKTMNGLRLDNIDPSDSMANFNHAMKFARTKGFSPIVPLIDIKD